jgi:hypothetical protein
MDGGEEWRNTVDVTHIAGRSNVGSWHPPSQFYQISFPSPCKRNSAIVYIVYMTS